MKKSPRLACFFTSFEAYFLCFHKTGSCNIQRSSTHLIFQYAYIMYTSTQIRRTFARVRRERKGEFFTTKIYIIKLNIFFFVLSQITWNVCTRKKIMNILVYLFILIFKKTKDLNRFVAFRKKKHFFHWNPFKLFKIVGYFIKN